MTDFGSVEEMYRSLFQQCAELSERNEEMELSIFHSLFQDKRYDMILEALEKGLNLTPEVQEMILESGDLKLYQYLHSRKELDLEWMAKVKIFTFAIKRGNLETVIWLFGCVSRKSEEWLRSAIRCNQLLIAKWLYSQGCPLYRNVWSLAIAYQASQDMLEWLFEIKHPFQYWLCSDLTVDGKLAALQWFRAHGCPWSRIECLMIAKSRYHHHIVKWIESQPE